MKKCIIFPHIPKCGGTSLKKQMESSKLKIYYDYEFPPNNSMIYFDEGCERRNVESGLLDFGGFDIVFGHFPLIRYSRKNYQYVTLIRHPVERAISHYFYWKNSLPITNTIAIYKNPIIQKIKNGDVGFIDFLRISKMTCFYRNYLTGFKPNEFDLVGFTDNYDSFLSCLSELAGFNFSSDVHERKGVKDVVTSLDFEEAKMILAEEIECFNEFQKFWERK